MRILQLAPPWFRVPPDSYGGIELMVSVLADGLVQAGHDVTLVASGDSRTEARLVSVFEEPPTEELGNSFIEAAQVLAGYLERGRYDVIHNHCDVVGTALGAVIEAPPVVHSLHYGLTEDRVRLYRAVAPYSYLVAISHHQVERMPADIPLAGVVYNGIPIERYRFVKEKEDFLLFVGRANREKGPEVAVEVARRLRKPLVMAIKINEPYEKVHWEKVVAPRLDDVDVTILRHAGPEEIVDIMGRAKAVLLPLQWPEPFGLVMAEANACGTPVVAFARGAAREVISDGQSGFLVEPGDIDSFCAAVERADSLDPETCRDNVLRNFTDQRMIAGYLQIYADAAADRSRRTLNAMR
ncbi:MAG: glycosyltransferase family 4 protein [Acidimicrobiia bacterium]